MKDTIQIRMYDNCEDKMKKISIVLPVYNGAKSVKKCIKSIFAQDYTNLEIIIVNDGSTDNSEEIIKSVIEEYGRKEYIKYWI
jgi:glycosyltransferase involved in cell wall biosynthesis